jgi:hypothetical protein
MIFWREGQYNRCNHSAVSKGNNIFQKNYKILVVQEIHISRLELKRWSLEYVFFFSIEYSIWDLGLGVA